MDISNSSTAPRTMPVVPQHAVSAQPQRTAPATDGTLTSPPPPASPTQRTDDAQSGVDAASATTSSEAMKRGPTAPVKPEDIEQALEEVQKVITPVAQNLRFSVDDDSGKIVVKVIDTATDEVIKQIPSEELLRMAKALDKLQGLLVEQTA